MFALLVGVKEHGLLCSDRIKEQTSSETDNIINFSIVDIST